MSKRALIQIFIGTLILGGILSLFNSYLALSKMKNLRKNYEAEAFRNHDLEKRQKALLSVLQETQEELNRCKGVAVHSGEK